MHIGGKQIPLSVERFPFLTRALAFTPGDGRKRSGKLRITHGVRSFLFLRIGMDGKRKDLTLFTLIRLQRYQFL